MGASGTDVAKEAAEIVLLDDSFSTLVRAVEQGRVIYANISKGVVSCLTSNAAELVVNIVSLILATVAGLPLAINVMQILAIDLLGELLPIAALGRDPRRARVMRRPPRDPKTHIINGRSIRDLMYAGSIIGVLAIGNYLLFYDRAGSSPFAGPVDPALRSVGDDHDVRHGAGVPALQHHATSQRAGTVHPLHLLQPDLLARLRRRRRHHARHRLRARGCRWRSRPARSVWWTGPTSCWRR